MSFVSLQVVVVVVVKGRRYEAWGCSLFCHKQFAKENRNTLEQKVVTMAVVALDAIELELGC